MHHKEDAGALHEDVVATFSEVNLSIYELSIFGLANWQRVLQLLVAWQPPSRMRVHVLLMALYTADRHSGSY